MRQERITKKARRRTNRRQEAAVLVLPETPTDLSEAEELLAAIDQLLKARS